MSETFKEFKKKTIRYKKSICLGLGIATIFFLLGTIVIVPLFSKQDDDIVETELKEETVDDLEFLGISGTDVFGETSSGGASWYLLGSNNRGAVEEYIRGIIASPTYNGSMDKIYAYCKYVADTGDVRAGIYDIDEKFMFESSNEIQPSSNTGAWEEFEFSPAVTINASDSYYLCVYGEEPSGANPTRQTFVNSIDANNSYYEQTDSYPAWSDPLVPSTTNSKSYSIYGSYSITNSVPTFADESPTNNSIDVSLTPDCFVVCNDDDGGDSFTVDFYSNESGSWVWQSGNVSVSPGDNVSFSFTNADTEGTEYWWNVTCNDGTDNSSDTYSFTTIGSPSPPDIMIVHDDDNDLCIDYKTWKEANSDFVVDYIDIDDITSNSEYFVNGTWGDNESSNPYYIAQSMADESKYNDSAAKLRNYIRDEVDTNGTSYIILLGLNNVPHRNFTYWSIDPLNEPCDQLYFGCLSGTQCPLDGDWCVDSLKNNVSDTTSDVVISRFPTDNDEYLEDMLNKSKSFTNLTWEDLQTTTYALYHEELSDEYDYDYLWTDESYGLKYSPLGGYEDTELYTFINGSGVSPGQEGQFTNCITQEQVDNDFEGIVNGINATHEDGIIMFDFHTHTDNGFYNYLNIGDYTNSSNPFFMFANGCAVGNFYGATTIDNCFNALLSPGGLVSFMGTTFWSYGLHTEVDMKNFERLFSKNVTTGIIFQDIYDNYSIDYNTGHLGKNLFGDPTLIYPYHDVPVMANMTPTIDESVYFGSVNLTGDALDFEDETITGVYLMTNASGSWVEMQSWSSVSSGTNLYNETGTSVFSLPETKYYYSWNVTDGTYWWNHTRHFTTTTQGSITFENCTVWYDVDSTPSDLFYETIFVNNINVEIDIMAYNSSNTTWWIIYEDTVTSTGASGTVTNTSWIDENNLLYLWSVNISVGGGDTWHNQSFPIYIEPTHVISDGANYSDYKQIVMPVGNDMSPHDDWAIEPSGEMWEAVDESTPDYNTTFIYNVNGSLAFHWFEIDNLTTTNFSINYVTFNMLTYNDYAGAKTGYFYIGMRNSSDENHSYLFRSDAITSGESETWINYTFNLTYNPLTNLSWTEGDVNNLSMRVGVNDFGENGNITQLKVEVVCRNYAPTLTNEYPTNESTEIAISIDELYVTVNDAEGESFDWTIESELGQNSADSNSSGDTINVNISGNLTTGTTYYWYVNITDGNNWNRSIFHFTTGIVWNNLSYKYGIYQNTTIFNNESYKYGVYQNVTVFNNISYKYGVYQNSTNFINESYKYGVYSNTTFWANQSYKYGFYSNQTVFQNFSYKYGIYENVTTFINESYKYGVYSNTSFWVNQSYKYGFYTNLTSFQNLSYKYGIYQNTTNFINESYVYGFYTNTTPWVNTSYKYGVYQNITIFNNESYKYGVYQNITNFQNISYINGIYQNISTFNNLSYKYGIYQNYTYWVNQSYKYGFYTNLTSFQNISYRSGTYINTSLFNNLSYKYGYYTNTSTYFNLSYKTGVYTNGTNYINITYKYGYYTNITPSHNISYKYGFYTNITPIPPINISNPYPSNESTGIGLQTGLYVTINSTTSETINISFYYGYNESDTTTLLCTYNNITNSTQYCVYHLATNTSETYYWRVQGDDGTNYVNETYSFTTGTIGGGQQYISRGLIAAVMFFGMFGFIIGIYIYMERKKNEK